MKKSWIIVLAFVFLWSAVPAFSAPLPVPSSLCLQSDNYIGNLRLILESKGKIGGVEYFDVTGSMSSENIGSLLKGSAHHRHKKILHLGLTGAFDLAGPGDGGGIYQVGYDVRYNLFKEKGALSYLYLDDVEGVSGTDSLTAVDCSSLPKPPY